MGATPSPHAKILTYINDNLAADAGIKLDIVEYTDYVQPNTALNDGDLDANFYQTVPYLENAEKQFGYDFEPARASTSSPSACSPTSTSPSMSCPTAARSASSPTRPTSLARSSSWPPRASCRSPRAHGDVNINTVTKLKNFDFREVEGPQLVRSLDDFDYAVINGNFAQEGGKTISGDALVVESPVDNPAVNILVWKKDSKKADAIAKLEKILHSDEVKQYIEKTWSDGSVIPAF